MVLDYSERKPAGKNRSRKQPVGLFAIILIGAVFLSFAAGLLSGWFMFKPARKEAKAQTPLVQDGAKVAPPLPPSGSQAQNPEASASKGTEPPLTFYETLPKGGKAVIGSGLNPKKTVTPPAPQIPVAPAPAPPPQQSAQQSTPLPAVAKPEERKEQPRPPAEQVKKAAAVNQPPTPQPAAAPGKFCVQVASFQDRKEAEAVKVKMAEKGLTVYIVESTIKDKGTWYRLRIGRRLTQQAAGEIAAKAGKGALVIPE